MARADVRPWSLVLAKLGEIWCNGVWVMPVFSGLADEVNGRGTPIR